jgi:hypothetical protein
MPNSVPKPLPWNECYALVGRFMNTWAFLENTMNAGIAKILGMERIEGVIATVNMQVRSKVHIIKTLIDLRGSPKEWVAASNKTMNEISAMADLRNTVAHTAFGPHDSGEGVEFIVMKAKGKLVFPDTIWSREQFETHYSDMERLTEELKGLTAKLQATRIIAKVAGALSSGQPQPPALQNALLPLLQGFPGSPGPTPPSEEQSPIALEKKA